MAKALKNKSVLIDNLSRREKFALRYSMINDNYKSQVVRHLTNIYSKAGDIKLDRQLDLSNNIMKSILNRISRVYSFGVNREFSDELTAEMYQNLNINKIMKEANYFVNGLNDILLQVGWNYNKNEPRLVFRYPHKTEVTLDEYDEVSEVEYFVKKIDNKTEKWAYWSNSEHYYKIYDGSEDFKIEYPEGNEEGINPYKILPFVSMQNGFRDGCFFDEFTGDDLVSITLDNCVYNTFKNYLIKWQSFKQLVITGSNIGELSGQMLDPSTALTASGENVNIDLLDLQANLTDLNTVLQESANNVAINYNISPSQFRMSGQISSGFALKMENISLDEFTAEQQADFIRYEKDLFMLLNTVSIIENNKPLGTFDVAFNTPEYKEAKNIELDSIIKEIDLGLTSPAKVLAARKDITEEEAQVIIDKNIAERNKIYNRVDTGTNLNLNTTAEAMGLN